MDIHGLIEVRNLSKLPPGLAKALGWQKDDQDRIADLEREPGTTLPRSIDRWFLLAGVSDANALVGIEEQHPTYGGSGRFHANSFALVGTHWIAGQEWVLSSQPHTVGEMAQSIQSPQSQALTGAWQQRLRSIDRSKRHVEAAKAAAYRLQAPMRKANINDEEVRQIEAVVRDLIPGAIVTISSVTEGCPCEEGPGCSAQVSTAIFRQNVMHSLVLSDINEHWVVGPIQQWYLESAKLDRTKFANFAAYALARESLNDRFPACATGPTSGKNQSAP